MRTVDAACPQPTSATRAPRLELGDDAVERGQPGVDEVRDVAGLEEPFGPDEQAGVVLVPAEALAGAEPVGDGVDVPEGADGDLHARGEVGRAVRVGEGRGLLRAQRIPVASPSSVWWVTYPPDAWFASHGRR